MAKPSAIDRAIAELQAKRAPLLEELRGLNAAVQALEHAKASKPKAVRKPKAVPTPEGSAA